MQIERVLDGDAAAGEALAQPRLERSERWRSEFL
jgi:hypothetical protein